MTLAQRLAGFELAVFPVWVMDPGPPLRVAWANAKAAELWRAPSLEELYARDFGAVPAAVKVRLDATLEVVRAGGSMWEEWTFYPKGEPIRAKIYFSPLTLDDGRFAVLQQVLPREEGPDPTIVRAAEALMFTSVIIALVTFGGEVLNRNTAAQAAFKDAGDSWPKWLCDPSEGEELLRAASGGEVVKRLVLARTAEGERFHAVEIRPIRDAVSGTMAALIHHTDETARVGAEERATSREALLQELDNTLAIVSRQREEILELSAPLLEVGSDTLAVPIIGQFDRVRSQEIAGRLLSAIQARRIRAVILDMTGAAPSDAAGADFLLQVVRAVALLGARPIMTGLRPALARTLADAGFDAGGAPVLRTLADGVRLSLKLR